MLPTLFARRCRSSLGSGSKRKRRRLRSSSSIARTRFRRGTDMIALANHLWQSTAFVVAAWLLTLALRNNRAAVRHWVWMASSVKFLVPFSLLVGMGSLFQWRVVP